MEKVNFSRINNAILLSTSVRFLTGKYFLYCISVGKIESERISYARCHVVKCLDRKFEYNRTYIQLNAQCCSLMLATIDGIP